MSTALKKRQYYQARSRIWTSKMVFFALLLSSTSINYEKLCRGNGGYGDLSKTGLTYCLILQLFILQRTMRVTLKIL
ncbi:hypothetical protein BJY04DRAFT_182233 [Aspergillus karnatakaensis]|uniref:uncharacterized protein n=1 Tax=Aspergillus karnatakaensis TaxID=1810916 RepID=UPI003CCE0D24